MFRICVTKPPGTLIASEAAKHACRDGKTYERASNARVNFFIVLVKSVTNSTLFFAKVSYVAIRG